jgi:hypothetical protein
MHALPPEAEAAAARHRAARAAARFWIGAGAFLDSVSAVEAHEQRYAHVLYLIERRCVVRRLMPHRGPRPAALAPLPRPGAEDPWSVDLA